jgi:hypothetical protein
MERSMQLLITLFLTSFLLDGAVTLANEFYEIPLLQAAIAWPVLVFTAVLYVAMAFTVRLPRRVILPPALFLIWAWICGGFPLPFLFPSDARLLIASAQTALGLMLLCGFVLRRPPPSLAPAGFSWRNFGIFAAANMLVAPVVVAVGAVQHLGAFIETQTGGYVKLRPSGLMFEERHFRRAGKEIRLVSMIHIGDEDFYQSVADSYPQIGSTVVLMEGVSDNSKLLKTGFSYSKLAEMVGLTPQESAPAGAMNPAPSPDTPAALPLETPMLEYRRADVDINVFRPNTIYFINAVAAFLADPTSTDALRQISDPSSPLNQPGAQESVLSDIVDKRNFHLIGEIDAALKTHDTIIIPWGALHLPFIETALLRWGFHETERIDRPAIRFLLRR